MKHKIFGFLVMTTIMSLGFTSPIGSAEVEPSPGYGVALLSTIEAETESKEDAEEEVEEIITVKGNSVPLSEKKEDY